MPKSLQNLSLSLQTRVRKLARKKHRAEFGEYLLEGVRLATDALQSNPESLRLVLIDEAKTDVFTPILEDCAAKRIRIYGLPTKDFSALAETEHTQGILAVAAMPEQLEPGQLLDNTIVTVLHEVSDPGNLGTVIRTADWFGANAILLSPGSADPWNPKAVRASMGSILRVQIGSFQRYDEILQLASSKGFTVFAADGGGDVALYNCDFPERTMLLFGSEAHGLPQEVLEHVDTVFRIPKYGHAESLNLAISHAATLTELRRQRP